MGSTGLKYPCLLIEPRGKGCLCIPLFSVLDGPKRHRGSGAGHWRLLQEDGICIRKLAVQPDEADRVGEEQERWEVKQVAMLRGRADGCTSESQCTDGSAKLHCRLRSYWSQEEVWVNAQGSRHCGMSAPESRTQTGLVWFRKEKANGSVPTPAGPAATPSALLGNEKSH